MNDGIYGKCLSDGQPSFMPPSHPSVQSKHRSVEPTGGHSSVDVFFAKAEQRAPMRPK